jgi:signal transduction histidine kinase
MFPEVQSPEAVAAAGPGRVGAAVRPPDLDLLRSVLRVLPVGLAVFDAGDNQFRLLYATAEFLRLLGLATSEAPVGTPAAHIFRGPQQPEILRMFGRVQRGAQAQGVFASARGVGDPESQATAVWSVDAYPVLGDDRVTHIVAVAQQTLDRLASRQRQEREAARLREQTARLAELERAKSEFLNLASHELRGPAAMLRGYLSMLEDGTLGPLPRALEEVLPLLSAKAAQINSLANEMVEAARLEGGQLQIQRHPVDLLEIMRRSVRSVQATAPRHRIILEEQLNAPAIVEGDSMRLEIIVTNLLDNAVKYSPGAPEVLCSIRVQDGAVLISVRDHGIGIAPEDMDRLFVRFGRLPSPAALDVPGTGLGLYLARELARLHGGDIFAVSKVGEGSEFALTLPRLQLQLSGAANTKTS